MLGKLQMDLLYKIILKSKYVGSKIFLHMKGVLVMKKFFLLLLLCGCVHPSASFEVEKIRPNELLGAGYDNLDGKIYSIFCGGNDLTDYNFVKNSCMQDTASFVRKNGYEYFSMLAKDGNTSSEKVFYTYNIGGTMVTSPETITKHSQSYTIVFVDENNLNKVNNYYKVSDYYSPMKKIKND